MTDDVPWLSREEQQAWRGLAALLEVLPGLLDAQLRRDSGLNRFEYMILAGLSESPGRMLLMSDLASFAAGSLSRLSHAVGRLERAGRVTRCPHAPDGRHTEVHLTDAGFAALAQAAPGHVREVRRLVLDALTPTQLAQLGRISRAIVQDAAPGVAQLMAER